MRHDRSEFAVTGRDNRLRWLLSASSLSNLGDGIGKVAFPLLAASLTRDPVLIAGLAATQFLPWLLCSMLVGALVDRVDRRRAMLLANLARAVVVGLMALLVYTGGATIWLVYVAALLIGAAETVADSAANVLVPAVVDGPRRLEAANSKLQAVEIAGQTFIGGPLGSATFAVFAAFPFLLNSAGFALAAALLLGLSGGYRPRRQAEHRRLRTDLADGVRWLLGDRLMLRLVAVAGAVAFVSELAQAQLVLYALEELGLSEAGFGVFALAGGVGGLAGAALAPRLIRAAGRFPLLLTGLLGAGAGFTGMGLTTQPVLSAVLFGLFAAAVVVVNVVLATVRHTLIPDELLGRVFGAWRTIVWGAIPVGALCGGLLTKLLGGTAGTFTLSGAALVLLGAGAWLTLRGHRHAIESAGRVPEPATGRSQS
ncbi:MFS transporter [Amycolatopsis suaedae]|uniref:MFS transporter n=1 Tax=Amycolatopsis suaedae TaxID=2510978 RepID=A0A4Q7J3V8_9PSEU|nr:MFS transporter [Amycolatopsis suaedae]RZQ62200.1 MFS transporter [Amycolatopsis suaedae]